METQPVPPWYDMRTTEEVNRDNFIKAWAAFQGLTHAELETLTADDIKALGRGCNER